jgi:hypothetical protein
MRAVRIFFQVGGGAEARKCASKLAFMLVFERVFIDHPRIFRIEEFFNIYL